MKNIIVRTYKYRMYPSKIQEQVLDKWIRLCRSVYNLCIEQRKTMFSLYYHQPMSLELNDKGFQQSNNSVSPVEDPRRYISWAAQCREVTLLRSAFPEYSEVPAGIMSKVVDRIDQAFKKYYSNIKDYRNGKLNKFPKVPAFSSRFEDFSLTHMRSNGFRIEITGNNMARIYGFPKIKQGLRIRYHIPIDGKVLQQQIKKEGKNWYLCITLEKNISFSNPKKDCAVGIDMGITRTIQLSTGEFENLPYDILEDLLNRKKVLQRRLKRKIGGNYNKKEKQSNNFKKAYQRIAKLDRKIVNIKKYKLKMTATEIARSNEIVGVEQLKIKNMTKSAKGSAENPGKNVKAKSSLNRKILLASPYFFRNFLKQKCEEHKSIYREVNPAYTSQDCSKCGHRDKKNRLNQSHFKCVSCGFELNADHNAAINIKNRAISA